MLIALLLSGVLVTGPFGVQASTGCSVSSLASSGCGVTNDGTSLTVSGTRQSTSIGSPSAPSANRPTRDSTAPPSGPSEESIRLARCLDEGGTTRCVRRDQPGTPPPDAPIVPAPRPITIADLAQFTPASIAATSEPSNVGIAGMPTNFVASADVQTRTGALFGAPVTVRFTPVAYVYTYGDGASSTLTTPGRTWSSLGQAQFSPTPTSHVYERRGTYTAEVDVRYAAEVDVGAGWVPVAGELTSDGIDQQIRIFEARTALVARTCIESPGAPGC